ncbi:polymyxin B resistance protein pmrD [Enterobacter asburiae]|uniref:polymyxin B resistance protein pmrD n=1 Tax=Enterobacter asburiae TaxID=61645 RepID=UPI00207568F1|nr:polymyxin B resistance protein pmrD [Enterobacter asburiae]MCM7773462.1 polymyxin B resistance protein pmrD [Enterobacter asburiae]
MEWLVTESIYITTTDLYGLVLKAGPLKIVAEVSSETPLRPGDILYPEKDANYLINNDATHPIKAISAVEFSAGKWRALQANSEYLSVHAI